MALSTTRSIVNYTGNGAAKAFTIPFAFDRASSIQAVLIAPNGTQTPQTQGSHFTVTPDGHPSSGTAIFAVAPPSGWTVRLMRIVPLTQLLQLVAQGEFNPKALEAALDHIVMALQQINDGIAVHVAHGDQPGGTLHELATRSTAGFLGSTQFAKWDDHVDVQGNPHSTTWEDVGAAPAGHSHSEYAPAGHTHSEYAGAGHNHDGRYATKEQGDQLRTEMDTAFPMAEFTRDTVAPKVSGWNNHVAIVNGNPHGTTAAHVGAAPVNHLHAQADVGSLGSDLTAIRGRLDALEGKVLVQGIVDVKPTGATLIAGVGIDSVTRTAAGKVNVKLKPGNMKSKDYVVVVTPFAGTGRSIAADVAIVDAANFSVTTYNRDNTAEDVGFRFIATDPT